MEEASPIYIYKSCMDTADVKRKLRPRIAGYMVQDTSIWMVPETFGDLMYGLPPRENERMFAWKGTMLKGQEHLPTIKFWYRLVLGGWLQPTWKICSSNWIMFPIEGFEWSIFLLDFSRPNPMLLMRHGNGNFLLLERIFPTEKK